MYRWCLIALLIVCWFDSKCQENPFTFSSLSEKDGLGNNVINSILKDHRGNIWMGTYNGFSRFDGVNFYNYKKRKGTNSPVNEVVHSICEDRTGKLWGATDNSVFSYDPVNDVYKNYAIKSLGALPNFTNILCDANGTIWAAGVWSVFEYNSGRDEFVERIIPGGEKEKAKAFGIRKNGLLADPSGKGLWIATRSGIVFYNTVTHTLRSSLNAAADDSLFIARNVSALSGSPTGHCWFFDNESKAAVSFDPVTQRVIQRIPIGAYMPNAVGGTLFEDRNHRLWFSSWSYEMLVIDLAHNNRVIKLRNIPGDNQSIAGQFFWAGFQDDDNSIWLGTISGLSRCNPEKSIYKPDHIYEQVPELSGTSIVLAEEDPSDKSTWIITNTGLLLNSKKDAKRVEKYDINAAIPASDGAKPTAITGISFLQGQVIVTTLTGAWQLERRKGKFLPFSMLPDGYATFKCREIVTGDDSLLYYTNGSEILSWNRKSGNVQLHKFSELFSTRNFNEISGMIPCNDHRLWFILSGSGLGYLATDGKKEKINFAGNEEVSNGTILNLQQDRSGTIWILYKGIGLYAYDPATHKTRKWDETDGLPGNRVHTIKLDRSGRVWSMLYNNVSIYSPAEGFFFNFKIPVSEGNLNYYNYLSARSDGSLIGSIYNELVTFYPDKLFAIPAPAVPTISRFASIKSEFNLFRNEKISLAPGDNTVRFRFGILIDKAIFPYVMEYRLEGAETNWSTAGDIYEAVYNNLPPGNYRFEVRAKGKNNNWQTAVASLSFVVRTPYYKAWWFLGTIALAGMGVMFFVYRYRIRQNERMMLLEKRAQLLEKEKAMVMYENLKQQLNPHFLFNSLTSLNSLIGADAKTASEFLDKFK